MKRIMWITICVIVVAIAVAALFMQRGREAVADPPLPADLDDLTPEVRTLVLGAVQTVQDAPRAAENWFRLGLIYEANKMRSLAAASYEQGLEIDPANPRAWYHLGLVRAELSEDERAAEAFQRAAEIHPDFPPVHWRAGYALLHLGEPEQAIEHFRAAIERDPRDPAAVLGLARAHLDLREPEKAVDLLEDLLLWNQQHIAYAHLLLSTAYRQVGRLEDAEIASRLGRGSALRLTDAWSAERLHYVRGVAGQTDRGRRLMGRGLYQEAIEVFERLTSSYPDEPMVWSNLGAAYLGDNQVDQAIETLRRGIEIAPGHAPMHYNLAAAYARLIATGSSAQQQRNWQRAMQHADRAIDIQRDYADPYRLRGFLLLNAGDLEGALAAYQRSVEYHPANPDLRYEVGTLLLRLDRPDEAVEAFDRALRLAPDHANAMVGLIMARLAQGKIDAADEVIAYARRRGADDPRIDSLEQEVRHMQANRLE